ncbi:hypothetical protein HQ535_01160 [bacterium]|nr:hypothetical protein [bacterium]
MGAFKKIKDMKKVVSQTPELIEQAQKLQEQAQGMQAAQLAAGEPAGAAKAIDPQLLGPIAGVTIEKYAGLSKAIGERKLDQAGIDSFVQLHGLTPEAWQTAYEGWNERFQGNMALSVHFGALYQQARSL